MPAAVNLRTARLIGASILASVVAAILANTIPPAFVAWGIVVLGGFATAYLDARYRRVSEFVSYPTAAALIGVLVHHPPSLPIIGAASATSATLVFLFLTAPDESLSVGFADAVAAMIAGLALSAVTTSPTIFLAVIACGSILAFGLNLLPASCGGRRASYPLAGGVALALVIALSVVVSQTAPI